MDWQAVHHLLSTSYGLLAMQEESLPLTAAKLRKAKLVMISMASLSLPHIHVVHCILVAMHDHTQVRSYSSWPYQFWPTSGWNRALKHVNVAAGLSACNEQECNRCFTQIMIG